MVLLFVILQAHVFRSKSGACAAFLANYDASYSVRVTYQNLPYDLPAWSVSILPDCKTVVYNTAKVSKIIVLLVSTRVMETFLLSAENVAALCRLIIPAQM